MRDWENISILNDSHTCHWCPADGCLFCTHQQHCIFDDEMLRLDREIALLVKQLGYCGDDVEVGGLVINPKRELLKRKIRDLEVRRNKS